MHSIYQNKNLCIILFRLGNDLRLSHLECGFRVKYLEIFLTNRL